MKRATAAVAAVSRSVRPAAPRSSEAMARLAPSRPRAISPPVSASSGRWRRVAPMRSLPAMASRSAASQPPSQPRRRMVATATASARSIAPPAPSEPATAISVTGRIGQAACEAAGSAG